MTALDLCSIDSPGSVQAAAYCRGCCVCCLLALAVGVAHLGVAITAPGRGHCGAETGVVGGMGGWMVEWTENEMHEGRRGVWGPCVAGCVAGCVRLCSMHLAVQNACHDDDASQNTVFFLLAAADVCLGDAWACVC